MRRPPIPIFGRNSPTSSVSISHRCPLSLLSLKVEGGTSKISSLGLNYRKFQIVSAPEREAEAEISAKVIAADGHIVAARIFDGNAPAKSSEEADAAKALNEAFGKILSALIPWTANVIAGGGEKPSPAPAQPKGRGQTCG